MNEDNVMEFLEKFKSIEKETVRLVHELAMEEKTALGKLLPLFAETFYRHVMYLYGKTEVDRDA